jgi:hypothetical protein
MANANAKTLIGVCLGIVLLASQASAECAWVLWWEESLSSLSYRNVDANIRAQDRTRSDHVPGISWAHIRRMQRARVSKHGRLATCLIRGERKRPRESSGNTRLLTSREVTSSQGPLNLWTRTRLATRPL